MSQCDINHVFVRTHALNHIMLVSNSTAEHFYICYTCYPSMVVSWHKASIPKIKISIWL